MARVLLINTNVMQPPVSPVGLDYVASAVEASGHEVMLLDLAFVARDATLDETARSILRNSPDVIGLSVRNTDDCSMATREFLLPQTAQLIQLIKARTEAPVVVGGIGFSTLPKSAFLFLGPDYGIAGDGELAFPELVETLVSGRAVDEIPGLLWLKNGQRLVVNPPDRIDLNEWPLPLRRHVDNALYLRRGGMVGIETKRGCPMDCIYCADPIAKGRRVRARPPARVVEEIQDLLDQGVDVYHTCDSEFNVPASHGAAVCEAIAAAGLGDRIRWYAYCAPAGFDAATARLYRRAGCQGINFGVDSGSDLMLQTLGRAHRREDIACAVQSARAAGMATMIDLLLGGPGESFETLRETFEMARSVGADRVGLSIGLRVYPGTPLAAELFGERSRQVHGALAADETQPDLLEPFFWTEPSIRDTLGDYVRGLVAGDPRFFFLDPAAAGANYNYSNNATLLRAIAKGYRGAFWDILRRDAEGLPLE